MSLKKNKIAGCNGPVVERRETLLAPFDGAKSKQHGCASESHSSQKARSPEKAKQISGDIERLSLSMSDSAEYITSTEKAVKLLKVEPPQDFSEVEKSYPLLVNDYYLSLIDHNRPDIENDPIWRQCMPSSEELEDESSSFDPLAEQEQMPVSRLIHRYPDRVVLLATGRCAMRCRFCFRKRTWANGQELTDITENELSDICDYLRETPQVSEVLVSGGDPLMLDPEKLKFLLEELSDIESISVLRLGSRVPVTQPARINSETIEMLSELPGLWLMTHFNHPRELTPESISLCREFIKAGIPILNQAVLLKGVNDDAEVLENLFRGLIAIKVKPHYLFHVDPVRGVRHFATGVEKGLEILSVFRKKLSSLAVPTFAIDLPEGGGKVALQPEYRKDGKFPSIVDQHLISY